MKKTRFSPKAVLALVLTLLLAALPCAVLAEDAPARQDIPLDSEEFQTLLHEVFDTILNLKSNIQSNFYR